jgi:hypothetical protein
MPTMSMSTWRFMCLMLFLVCLVLAFLLFKTNAERNVWALRWDQQSHQFQSHMACMRTHGCNSMAMKPLPAE